MEKSVVLPILGMTCANCSAAVERSLRKEAGVKSASVNLSTEKATVDLEFKLELPLLVDRVRRAGYDVAMGEATFLLENLSDNSDALVLEKRIKELPGIYKVQINLSNSLLRVEYVPTEIEANELTRILRELGYKFAENVSSEDAEAMARKREMVLQRHYLIVGLIFTIPLFALSMANDFGLLPGSMAHSSWINWIMLALATPVQFYVGRFL